MLRISNMNIYHIRGDTDSITVLPKNADGTDIEDFSAVFSVKKKYSDEHAVFQIPLKNGTIDFAHETTQGLEPGDYVWDIELRLNDGQYQTIGPGIYHLLPDVTTE